MQHRRAAVVPRVTAYGAALSSERVPSEGPESTQLRRLAGPQHAPAGLPGAVAGDGGRVHNSGARVKRQNSAQARRSKAVVGREPPWGRPQRRRHAPKEGSEDGRGTQAEIVVHSMSLPGKPAIHSRHGVGDGPVGRANRIAGEFGTRL
jgi:hypothetical protein